MVDPRTQWMTLGLGAALTAVLWLMLGGWQWWFPGLWFVALAVVGVTGARTRARSGPRTPAADDPRRR